MRTLIIGALTLGLALTAAPAVAHHSSAMFDAGKTVTVSGTVKEWRFTNPHCWLVVVALSPTGATTEWNFEAGAPSQLIRGGITKASLPVGEKVTVTTHPLKDGASGGSLMVVTRPGGAVVSFSRR